MYLSPVRRLVRPIAVLVILVLLQLVLVESGYACCMAPVGTAPGVAMADMQMPGSADHSPAAPTQPDEQQVPCRFPCALSGCQAMASCALPALTVASTANALFAPARVAPPQLVLLAPLSLSLAPEPPPPRA